MPIDAEPLPAENAGSGTAENTGTAKDTEDTEDIVARARAPVLVLQLPALIVAAASPGAHALFGPIATPLLGRTLSDLVEPHSPAALQLLGKGLITGVEVVHRLKKTGERRRFWFTAVPDTGAVLAVALSAAEGHPRFTTTEDDDALRPVLGTADARLMIDRLSAGVLAVLGRPAERLLGSSLFAWFDPDDVPPVLAALADAARSGAAPALRVGVLDAGSDIVRCQLVILPLVPPPSCAFALLPERAGDGPADARTVAQLITRLRQGVRAGIVSPSPAPAPLRPDVDLGHLTGREQEVIAHLVAGDRVPAIAKRLFLSEGTIRNNLSSAFAKLGVKNQQQLIELVRPAPGGQTPRT